MASRVEALIAALEPVWLTEPPPQPLTDVEAVALVMARVGQPLASALTLPELAQVVEGLSTGASALWNTLLDDLCSGGLPTCPPPGDDWF